MAKKNGTPGQLDNNASDLLNFIYEFSDKPEVLSLIDDLVNKLKKITNREAFYEVCEFSPKLSSTLENLIKVKEHEDAIARKKDEKRGKYTIEKKYAHAFKEYSDYVAPRIDEAVRAMAVQDLEALKALEGDLIIYGSETNFESNSVKKTKQRHRQLTQLKAALAALYVLNERQRQIMKLKLALQAVLELQTETEQTPVKKGITREELERARAEKDFDKKPITIKGSHRASKKYINEANQTLRSTGAYLKGIGAIQTAKQDIEKGPTYRK